ncbi:13944_t:CDS:10 [Funneliformis mosseae]|uniref:13944_t:CDS:1 n=1 Tax=Funneliformis mosseae TaxID=27381 RepID=A0A9N8VPJ7_FUNMO|nr:13944_t:CDS:10 [Funneliformis mosseae]
MPNHLITLFLIPLLFTLIYAEYRTLNGTNNNLKNPSLGVISSPLSRSNPPISFYTNINNDNAVSMIPTPGNYSSRVPKAFANCTAALPKNVFPLPRCASNKIGSIQANMDDVYNLDLLDKYKSKRKISHIFTYWGFFTKMDISSGDYSGVNYPTGIYIPQDDQTYLSQNPQNASLVMYLPAMQFNRSSPTAGSVGKNAGTPFLDGSQLYGHDLEKLSRVRDYWNHGKMLLYYSNHSEDSQFGYPPTDENGEYIFGYTAIKGRNVFTDMFHTVFLREHNRRCDLLWNIHGDDWDDEIYFQECRKWVIALLQRVTFYEYLGIALGSPLPPYEGYNPSLVPSIDTFFSTVTYRYGHSEVSDYHSIVDNNGQVLATLSLNSLQRPRLLETYGVPSIALSLALQRQEETDIFFSDLMRNFTSHHQNITEYMDIFSIDVIRNRDHVIPLYNDAREAMGLKRATKWSDITNDTVVQSRLIETYSNDIDKVEAYLGGLAEDHWMLTRDSDRLWFEEADAELSYQELFEINHTTLSQIIARNSPETYKLPANIWITQPSTSLKSVTPEYTPDYIPNNDKDNVLQNDLFYSSSNHLTFSDDYEMFWEIIGLNIHLKLISASTVGWFAIGFSDPNDRSMITSDMIICRNINESYLEVKQYKANAYFTPQLVDDQNQLIQRTNQRISSGLYTHVEIVRPLNVKGSDMKPITADRNLSLIYAWNPNSNVLTYHAGNRGVIPNLNFFSDATFINKRRQNLLSHGIGMFLVWGNLQLFGTVIVAIFGGIALAIMETRFIKGAHGIIGITIFCIMGVQIGIGMFNIWNLVNVESVNMGIIKLFKIIHLFLGIALIILAWVNMYIGIKDYNNENFWSNNRWITIYLIWIGLIVATFFISENIFRMRNMKFLYTMVNEDTRVTEFRLQHYIRDYDQLPTMTLDEFNQRVIRGMKLVIVEGMIFDISKWMKYHPGGVKILQRVIGTDITKDFFYITRKYEDSQSSSNDDKEEFLTFNEKDQQFSNIFKRNNMNRRDKNETFANFIDIINVNKFFGKKLSRVAVHSHSLYATTKLATMVVAKLITKKEEIAAMTNHDIYKYGSPIVKKFTLKPIRKHDNFPVRKFIPGDYIEIMCYIDNQMIIRKYTPLLQEFSEEYDEDVDRNNYNLDRRFWILVKIYKDGFMSKYMDRQLNNFEISVRGPFNVSESIFKNIPMPIGQPIPNILLNPNQINGCWSNLFMICGGSGITPMLQLEYQSSLKQSYAPPNTYKLHLLFANNTAADIIYPKHLDSLVRKFKGNLTIDYILSNPPDNWDCLKGYIDDVILFDWLSFKINIGSHLSIDIDPNLGQQSQVEYTSGVIPNQTVYYPRPQDPLIESSVSHSTVLHPPNIAINYFPDESKIIVCGNKGFMISIQDICNRIGIKEGNTLFLV